MRLHFFFDILKSLFWCLCAVIDGLSSGPDFFAPLGPDWGFGGGNCVFAVGGILKDLDEGVGVFGNKFGTDLGEW